MIKTERVVTTTIETTVSSDLLQRVLIDAINMELTRSNHEDRVTSLEMLTDYEMYVEVPGGDWSNVDMAVLAKNVVEDNQLRIRAKISTRN
jgi:hypothetical protein